MGGYQMCAENVNSHKCQRHFEVPPSSVFPNKVQLLQMDCSLFKMKKENNLKKRERKKKQGAAGADVLLNTLTPINHWLVSPAIYQQLLPRLGPGDGQYIRRQAQSLFTPLRNPLLSHCTQTAVQKT